MCTEKKGGDSYSVVPLFQWQLDLLAGKVASNKAILTYIHTYMHTYIHIYTYTYFIYKYILYLHGYNLGVSHDVADLQNFAAVKNKWQVK